ncbi:putative glycoside hydrolase [Endozoicomonas elysicola]|uniref:ExoP galactose-binding-like domain-containing protein n=1 Tax=Endozoicomonas elysicola TaxID=305900 RepID=A0A081KBI1_9GAMM|nr:putative glycoside hydrolase [Endozoicomonas elysicola]KEI71507.1 hypothetical protein GV64_12835 [Endozoicomonas elysicola]
MDKPLTLLAKSILLATLSVTMLSGCVEDNYDYPEDGTNPPVDPGPGPDPDPDDPNTVVLYGDKAGSVFTLKLADSVLSEPSLVPGSGIHTVGAISTQPAAVDGELGDPLAVAVDLSIGSASDASILTDSTESQDLSNTNSNGTLHIEVSDINNLPVSTASNLVTVSTGATATPVDITDAIYAFTAAESTQKIRVPLSCFADVDFTQVDEPFRLTTSTDLNFTLGKVIMSPDSLSPGYDLPCTAIANTVLDDAESLLLLTDETSKPGGIAAAPWTATLTGLQLPKDGSGAGASGWSITDADPVTKVATLTATIPDTHSKAVAGVGITDSKADTPINLRNYIENGILSFDLSVTLPAGSEATTSVTVSMQDNDDFEAIYTLTADQISATPKTVTIPVKEFVKKDENGNALASSLLAITKPFMFKLNNGEKNDQDELGYLLRGAQFTIADLKLVMNPAPVVQ